MLFKYEEICITLYFETVEQTPITIISRKITTNYTALTGTISEDKKSEGDTSRENTQQS